MVISGKKNILLNGKLIKAANEILFDTKRYLEIQLPTSRNPINANQLKNKTESLLQKPFATNPYQITVK